MKKRILFLLIIIFVVLASLVAFSFYIFIKYTPDNSDNSNQGEINISDNLNDNLVLEVIDGDTFKLGNGDVVRLICVDAPERGKKGYEEAKEFLIGMILDKDVRLESDADDKDEYGRLLRYVWVNSSELKWAYDVESLREIFVNKELVVGGYASVFRYGNSTKRCGEIEG